MPEPKNYPPLLTRKQVCKLLGISKREFYIIIKSGRFHPLMTRHGHYRLPLTEILAYKAELSHRALTLPYEKFIQASAFFAKTPTEVNNLLAGMHHPKAPVEYIERQHHYAKLASDLPVIRKETKLDFFAALGPAKEILYRQDLRLLVECLLMIQRGEKEIAETIQRKYGRKYSAEDIACFARYFYDWPPMDPESIRFYFEFIQGREHFLKECAHQRADYFIYYALGIESDGDVAELLEKSCLGLFYKLDVLIKGHVYGDATISPKEIQNMATIIGTLLGAAKSCREGKMNVSKQRDLVERVLPVAITRGDFFESEKEMDFEPGKKTG